MTGDGIPDGVLDYATHTRSDLAADTGRMYDLGWRVVANPARSYRTWTRDGWTLVHGQRSTTLTSPAGEIVGLTGTGVDRDGEWGPMWAELAGVRVDEVTHRAALGAWAHLTTAQLVALAEAPTS
ncbi:hypothetical protein [Tsukamurella soli]|uniref:Uncharacterized protein n=1 Tax=Tsukamurella soli TaxID=644556 RepID=A0ABP8J7I5_9ACTN